MKVYKLRVALTGGPYIAQSAEETWRIIEIKGNQTLDHLHRAIFRAFDRWEEHLYSFFMQEDRRDPSHEYTSPIDIEEFESGGPKPHNAKRARLDDLGLSPRTRFYYVFDFGDCWQHLVDVVSTEEREAEGRYPRIVEKHGESPPQYRREGE